MSETELEEYSYVKVLYDFQYKTTEGREVAIKQNERLYLLQKTNADWWQVVRSKQQRSFYVPATYVREISITSRARTIIEEDEDVRVGALDGPKQKMMPKETSSAMRNVKKWLANAADSKQEHSSKFLQSDAQKHNAMDYTTRAELKIGLSAMKTKSLERDQVNMRSSQVETAAEKKTLRDEDAVKTSRSFSSSPKSFDIAPKTEIPFLDPFREELESSLDRRRKKSDNSSTEKPKSENRKPETSRNSKIRTKSCHSDDSHVDSDDTDDKFLLRNNNDKYWKVNEENSKLSRSLYDELSEEHTSVALKKNSKSLDLGMKFCNRTERSLSPKPAYGHQLTLVGQSVDDEADENTGDTKILNDKRRTWAVEELMSELTQMCKERITNKKPNFQLKCTEVRSNFDPVDELTKELHEINVLRSEGNTPQTEGRDFKLTPDVSSSNICKIAVNSKDIGDLSPAVKTIKKDDDQHFNGPDVYENSLDKSLNFSTKSKYPPKFTIRTEVISQSNPLKSPKSPKLLDEYNEANILNDCSLDDTFANNPSLSHDKQSNRKRPTNDMANFSISDIDRESAGYSNISNIKINQHQGKVKMRQKSHTKTDTHGDLRLTPSLEKLASEIQFMPARKASIDKTKNAGLSESMSDGDAYDDSGIHEETCRSEDSWNDGKYIQYSNSFKSKREGRYFTQLEFSSDDDHNDHDDDKDTQLMKNLKKAVKLKKSSTLHFTTIPENYRRFRATGDNFISKSYKRRSRSLSDLRYFEDDITKNFQSKHYPQESPKYKPIPLPRTKVPISPNDLLENKKIPAPRKANKQITNNYSTDRWDKENEMSGSNVMNIESSTAVGFKTLLCTSDSGSDNCLQSKELPLNSTTDDRIQNQCKNLSSNVHIKQNRVSMHDSPSNDQILSSNASSEALQSQSESEVTATFDTSFQPSPINASGLNRENYECTINLPPGWIQKYDPGTDQICFINQQGEKWFSSNDDEGKIYFFEENSNESTWVLPTISPDQNQSKSGDKVYSSLEESSASKDDAADNIQHVNQLSISNRENLDKKIGSLNDWPQLSFDGNMKILKEGPLSRTKITENGKKLRKNWNTSYAVLTELFLLFFKDSKTFNTMMKSGQSPIAKPDISVDLNGASIEPGERASSRKNVYMIGTVLGLQVLIQSDNTTLAAEWFQQIHGVIQKLPFSFKLQNKTIVGPSEFRKISNSKLPAESTQASEDSKKSSKVIRSRSMKTVKRLDDSLEDLSGTPAERQTKIKAKLRRFFQRRPTVESLVKNGIYKDEPAFGSYLKDVCPTEPPRVPIFVKTCIEVLESNEENMKTDGLYRASGNLSQIQKIRLQIDQFKLNVLYQEEDVHVLTGALKLFFRELKEPLIPSSFFKEALNASMLKKNSAKIQCFREIVHALPAPNYDTLQFLLKHLLKVTSYQEYNRMHIPNLAIVFGPTLMWPAEESANMALDLMQQNLVIECLLSEYSQIFK